MSSERPADRALTDEETLQRELSGMRQRARRDAERAYAKGKDAAAAELLDIVDDCDRALRIMEDAEPQRMVTGVEQLRRRTLHHFQTLGYEPFGEVGEQFDPLHHEAVSVEAGAGPDGSLLRVHRRGWRNGGDVVRPALVTVLKGSAVPVVIPTGVDAAELRRARAHRVINETLSATPAAPADSDYVCPYGVSGCTGDCTACSPPPVEEETPLAAPEPPPVTELRPDGEELTAGDDLFTPDEPFVPDGVMFDPNADRDLF